MRRYAFVLAVLLLAMPASANQVFDHAEHLASVSNRVQRIPFTVEASQPILDIRGDINLTSGLLRARVLDSSPSPKETGSFSARTATGTLQHLKLAPGTYVIEITEEKAVGDWHLWGDSTPIVIDKLNLIGGGLMVLVGLAAAGIARWILKIQWRWLWCGALLWAIAVAAKMAIAFPLNTPVLGMLKGHLPHSLYLTAGSVYIGLLTGITEVLFTLLAGLWFRKLAADARRAVGIGLGAGAIEAILLGLGLAIAALVMPFTGNSLPAITLATLGVGAFERVLVIPCHGAVRAMTLYTVATRRWSWFLGAFVIFSGMDAIAGSYYLTGWINTANPWLLEVPFIPFAVGCILILVYLWRHWPVAANPAFEVVEQPVA